jgi:chromodomain protein Y
MAGTFKRLYTVEAILDKKLINGATHYLVKWKDYSKHQNTWEPLNHLTNVKWMIENYENAKQNQAESAIQPSESFVQTTVKKRGRPPKNRDTLANSKPEEKETAKSPKVRGRKIENSERKPRTVQDKTMKSIGVQTFLLPPTYFDDILIKKVKRIGVEQ